MIPDPRSRTPSDPRLTRAFVACTGLPMSISMQDRSSRPRDLLQVLSTRRRTWLLSGSSARRRPRRMRRGCMSSTSRRSRSPRSGAHRHAEPRRRQGRCRRSACRGVSDRDGALAARTTGGRGLHRRDAAARRLGPPREGRGRCGCSLRAGGEQEGGPGCREVGARAVQPVRVGGRSDRSFIASLPGRSPSSPRCSRPTPTRFRRLVGHVDAAIVPPGVHKSAQFPALVAEVDLS